MLAFRRASGKLHERMCRLVSGGGSRWLESVKTIHLRGKGTMDRKEGGPGRKETSWRAGGGDECSDGHTDNVI